MPLADAVAHVLDAVAPTEPVPVTLAHAQGLVIAETVTSRDLVPPFDNTAMDGFAVRAADTAGATAEAPVELAVVATAAAGPTGGASMGAGQAVRIMTGAAMPPGADAVVMVERTRPVGSDDASDRVAVEVEVAPGTHVRRAGEDVAAGDVVAEPGDVATPARIGVLANVGCHEISVHRRPVVGVISTGDELRDADTDRLDPGCIRDSNRPMLLAQADAEGFGIVDLGHVRDDPDQIREVLLAGLDRVDALVTSGGVSVGDFDLVKVVLDDLGDMTWMQIAIKPAKPFAFGMVASTPVFGLPGNPVSSAVSFELLARPALRRMAGHRQLFRRPVRAVAAAPMARRPDGKTHFVRVRLVDEPGGGGGATVSVEPAGGQGSHQLTALADADGLAIVPDGDGIAAGEPVDVIVPELCRSTPWWG